MATWSHLSGWIFPWRAATRFQTAAGLELQLDPSSELKKIRKLIIQAIVNYLRAG